MSDLIDIMGKLVDVNGKILIPGVNDAVAELTEEEKLLYGPIDFDAVRYINFSTVKLWYCKSLAIGEFLVFT